MYLTSQEVQNMDEAALNSFVSRKLQEGRHLDYKLCYEKPASHDGKKEFLKDVTGMANAGGGTIIIGVEESAEGDGLPGSITGIDDGENQSQTWENLTKDSIGPRIPGIFTKLIALSNRRSIIIVYIPPSLRKPHMVMIKDHRGFYIRHNKDTVPMSVDEIRTVVLSVEGAPDKAQAYLLARELDIRESRMFDSCPLLLQAIPVIPLDVDIDPLSNEIKQISLDPQDRLKVDKAEGIILTLKTDFGPSPILWGAEAGSSRNDPDYLTEIHRNGYIQALISTTYFGPSLPGKGDHRLYAEHQSFFKSFLMLCELITEQQEIASPYLIRVIWIGARGGYFNRKEGISMQNYGPWELGDLILPNVIHQPGDAWQPLADKLYRYLCNAFRTTE